MPESHEVRFEDISSPLHKCSVLATGTALSVRRASQVLTYLTRFPPERGTWRLIYFAVISGGAGEPVNSQSPACLAKSIFRPEAWGGGPGRVPLFYLVDTYDRTVKNGKRKFHA